MMTALLFPHQPVLAAATFTGAYVMGIVAALGTAFLFKRTVLPGETKPLVLELPGYKMPGLKTALLYTYDRARIFVKRAGTIILGASIILWALASYPKGDPPPPAESMKAEAGRMESKGDVEAAAALRAEASSLSSDTGQSRSASRDRNSCPTAPVAPTIATLRPFLRFILSGL